MLTPEAVLDCSDPSVVVVPATSVGSAVKLDAKSETEAGYARILVDLPVLLGKGEALKELMCNTEWRTSEGV